MHEGLRPIEQIKLLLYLSIRPSSNGHRERERYMVLESTIKIERRSPRGEQQRETSSDSSWRRDHQRDPESSKRDHEKAAESSRGGTDRDADSLIVDEKSRRGGGISD